MRMPAYRVIGIVFTFESSRVMWPSHAGSMNPAVLWMSSPSRPSELFPSTRETMSSGSRMRSRVDPRTNSFGCRMNGVFGGTWTSSVMSSSGRARSMNAWRLERNTRKRWSRRMSTDAGCTHFGSNGSIPMRPASIAARMSRSERTTTTEYAGLRPTQREHRGAQLAPRTHAAVGVRQRRTREPPEDLDGVRAGRLPHGEIGRAVADHDGFLG